MASITWGAPKQFCNPVEEKDRNWPQKSLPGGGQQQCGPTNSILATAACPPNFDLRQSTTSKTPLATRPNWGKSVPVHECSDWVFFVRASISFSSIVARQGEPKEHNQRQKHSETRARHNSYRNLEPEHQLSSTYHIWLSEPDCWLLTLFILQSSKLFLWQQLWQQLPGHSKDKAPKKLATKL